MKHFVVLTYYQLMHSIAMALSSEEPCSLYFVKSYLDLSDDVLEKIEETDVFSKVVGTDYRGKWKYLSADLKKTQRMSPEEIDSVGNSLFEKHLTPYYEQFFKGVDFNEEIYIYNDFQWIYYYIANHFKNIIGVEDGYKSLRQQMSIHKSKGDYVYRNIYIERGFYPKLLYRGDNVKRIISSCDYDDLDPYYKNKLEILDFKELVQRNKEQFEQALCHIFRINDFAIEYNSSIILGQPLARAKYCTSLEEYLLNRKIIKGEQKVVDAVYYKQHPAEKHIASILQDSKTKLLPREFPIEVLNYYDCFVKRGVTFGSTALQTCSFIETKEKLIPEKVNGISQVKEAISEFIEGETLEIQIYILAKTINLTSYINMLSYHINHPYVKASIKMLVQEDEVDSAKAYYDLSNKNTRIDEFQKRKGTFRDQVLWVKEINELKNVNNSEIDLEVIPCTELCEDTIFCDVIPEDLTSDYVMVVDENNPGFDIMKQIIRALETKDAVGVCFQNYTSITNHKRKSPDLYLSPGFVDNYYSNQLINRLWHRTIIKEFKQCKDYLDILLTVNKHRTEMVRKFSNTLYISEQNYLKISKEEGFAYYAERINRIASCQYRNGLSRDEVSGLIAIQIYDFIDWMRVTGAYASQKIDAIRTVFEHTQIDDALKSDALIYITKSLVYEKDMKGMGIASQDETFYKYSRGAIINLSRKGVIKEAILEDGKENTRKPKASKKSPKAFLRNIRQ